MDNINVVFSHCKGSLFASKPRFKISTTADLLQYLNFFTDNYLVFTNNNTWVPELRTNTLAFDDFVTGMGSEKITANSTRIVLSQDVEIVLQNSPGKVLEELVTTATDTQLRLLSQDGTTMWKLQPPTS